MLQIAGVAWPSLSAPAVTPLVAVIFFAFLVVYIVNSVTVLVLAVLEPCNMSLYRLV